MTAIADVFTVIRTRVRLSSNSDALQSQERIAASRRHGKRNVSGGQLQSTISEMIRQQPAASILMFV